jgi:hypothetical protein
MRKLRNNDLRSILKQYWNMAVTVAAGGNCTNRWKDSNEPGGIVLIMHILGVHRM